MNIKKEDIKKSYLALKKSLYYENNVLLYLKKQIADFEKENLDLEKKFEEIAENLNKCNREEGKLFIKNLIEKINYKKVIKKLEEKTKEERIIEKINSNKNNELSKEEISLIFMEEENQLEIKKEIKYNYIIDCPIELQIIAVLWVMEEGCKLDKEIEKYSYGYRLDIENGKFKRNIFKMYIKQYQTWKKNGIKKAKEIIAEGENAVLVNLDLKEFYYNINHKKLEEKIKNLNSEVLNSNISKIIFKINKKYDKIVSKSRNSEKGCILPIGLYSSPILANFYLKELDNEILLNCYPDYYGRYVDDLFFVFKEYRLKTIIDKKAYLEKKFMEILKEDKIKKIGIEKSLNEKLLIENKKHDVIFLDDEKSRKEIYTIEKRFLERASTFVFLPNEKEIENLYKKISLENEGDFKNKKYDVAIYLAKILDTFSGVDTRENIKSLKETSEILLDFFINDNIIKYFVYYEKVFIFLVMGGMNDYIKRLYIEIKKYLDKIEPDEKNRNFLIEYLDNSLYFALSLNQSLVKELELNLIKDVDEVLESIINSNMFRQKYIFYPLINYLKPLDSKKKIDFFKTRYFDIVGNPIFSNELELDNKKIEFSPRFIHLDEINNFYIKKYIFKQQFDENIDYWIESEKKYELNFQRMKSKDIISKNNKILLSKFYKKVSINNLEYYKIKSSDSQIKDYSKIKIGIASLLIKGEEIIKLLDEFQPLKIIQKERIINILNEAKKNKVNILIFPELSIPFQWLKIISEFSRKNQILITGGLEYLYFPEIKYEDKNKKNIFNYLFTTLPFKRGKYNTALTKIRLKNYYAPGERKIIEGKNLSIPELNKKGYDIFSWEGIHFSNFNCYELSDIEARARLKNYIDLLIASVFNKDINYFRNILEASCRDLHTFIAQSNTSIYGECCVIQPTSKESMILGNIKGGINDNLMVVEINIESLRKFQLLNLVGQKDNGFYKQTPPELDPDKVKARIDNKVDEIFEEEILNIEKELKKEIAIKMLQNSIEIEKVIDILGLSSEEINELK